MPYFLGNKCYSQDLGLSLLNIMSLNYNHIIFLKQNTELGYKRQREIRTERERERELYKINWRLSSLLLLQALELFSCQTPDRSLVFRMINNFTIKRNGQPARLPYINFILPLSRNICQKGTFYFF